MGFGSKLSLGVSLGALTVGVGVLELRRRRRRAAQLDALCQLAATHATLFLSFFQFRTWGKIIDLPQHFKERHPFSSPLDAVERERVTDVLALALAAGTRATSGLNGDEFEKLLSDAEGIPIPFGFDAYTRTLQRIRALTDGDQTLLVRTLDTPVPVTNMVWSTANLLYVARAAASRGMRFPGAVDSVDMDIALAAFEDFAAFLNAVGELVHRSWLDGGGSLTAAEADRVFGCAAPADEWEMLFWPLRFRAPDRARLPGEAAEAVYMVYGLKEALAARVNDTDVLNAVEAFVRRALRAAGMPDALPDTRAEAASDAGSELWDRRFATACVSRVGDVAVFEVDRAREKDALRRVKSVPEDFDFWWLPRSVASNRRATELALPRYGL
jgi:hypothetical protein